MSEVKLTPVSRKGTKVHEDKGGRTERLYSTAKPEIKEKLAQILSKQQISLADWIEAHVEMEKFHARAIKLMMKGKPLIVVANDEPYFEQVYSLIRENELKKGKWNRQDEDAYRELTVPGSFDKQ